VSDTPGSDLVTQLVKLVVDLTWFLDSVSDDEIDADWAVRWQEHIGVVLLGLPTGQQREVMAAMRMLKSGALSEAPGDWLERFQEGLGLLGIEG
jgi:hypothetical protein